MNCQYVHDLVTNQFVTEEESVEDVKSEGKEEVVVKDDPKVGYLRKLFWSRSIV